jgi:uncharacterized protein (DUF302 family)
VNTISEPISYGRVTSTRLGFDEAHQRLRDALKAEGFGVLCDIDVAATMREKLGIDFRKYRILGACNPQLAYKALTVEPHLGLLLPCSVVVQEVDGKTLISAIDAAKMMGLIGNDKLREIAHEAGARLDRALNALSEERL